MFMISNCITYHLATNVGNSRQNQEDNVILPNGSFLRADLVKSISENRQTYEASGRNHEDRFLAAVSDGMGGHACGEVASLLTVAYMSEHYDEIIDSIRLGENALAAQISRINSLVTSKAKMDSACRGMGATLCGVISNEYELVGFNIGDSRLYQFRNGELKQLSTDHTEGQRLLRMQLLTEEEVKNFPRRKNLHKYIGYDGEVIPDIFRISSAEQGTILLLCTDGLSDVMADKEIAEILNGNVSIKDKARKLVDEAVSRNLGHGDNTTVILIGF